MFFMATTRKKPDINSPLCNLLPAEMDGFASLAELALDLRWSWKHSTDELWRKLDPELWDLTRNPWVVLQTVSRSKLAKALAEPAFRKMIDDLAREKRQALESPAWFQQNHSRENLDCVAYFSMEFMLCEALPIYSGGLGNVAGDQLKAASDLGVPVIGVGLLYQQGYFRQVINKDGVQQALYPYNDPGQLPIVPLRDANGEWVRLEIKLPGYSVWLRAWQAQVGRVKLYLLDSNDAANYPAHRGITSELYGGGTELRLKQELALGIGGWRLLRALGLHPQVCHLNEGHAAFAILERARNYMEETRQSFEIALAVTRTGNLFTTHTAVPAGFDRFPPALIQHYLEAYAHKMGLGIDSLLALGRLNPHDATEPFNMAYLAMRGSGAINGVSRLHADVSRKIFSPLFPGWPEVGVPIEYVTNGVHVPSWDSVAADALWTEACGKGCWLGNEMSENSIRQIPDAKLWKMRTANRTALIEVTRKRLIRELAVAGASPDLIENAGQFFDPNALTLGFARRFATYKRPNLLLHDPERLLRLLTNPQRPVQLILAGKAHPADVPGQAMIQKWLQFISRPNARPHVVFLSDYDMLLTEQLVQGVDVWLNTPRRPWEACGTSGMKVLVNGGLNLSELDGWWVEAYAPEVGWAIGDGKEHGDDAGWDAAEASLLYERLEREIVPEFYDRDAAGIPTAWVARVRESMARLTPRFSASRAVREYTEKHYLPAAKSYTARAAGKGAAVTQIVEWRKMLEQKWAAVRFGEVKMETKGDQHGFEVQVYLNTLDPNDVKVELYADGINGGPPIRQEMSRLGQTAGPGSAWIYTARVPANRPAPDFTARVYPHREGVAVPLETVQIHWQR